MSKERRERQAARRKGEKALEFYHMQREAAAFRLKPLVRMIKIHLEELGRAGA